MHPRRLNVCSLASAPMGRNPCHQQANRNISTRPSPGPRPTLDALSSAAEVKGESAESLEVGRHHAREFQDLSLGISAPSPRGGLTTRMEELGGTARFPAEFWECVDFASSLNLSCFSPGPKCLFRDLYMIPRAPPSEFAALGPGSSPLAGRAFRMFLAVRVKGC